MGVAPNGVKVLIAVGVVGKARGEIAKASSASLLEAILKVNEGTPVAVVEAKLSEQR